MFAGSRLIQSKPDTRAFVTKIGFQTAKGMMIRDILYPKPLEFQFVRDSYYFVAVMTLISIIGYIISIPKFIEYGFSTKNIVFRSLDLITIAVPPSLPAILASSIAFAIKRLKAQNIYCIQPGRVNICGRIDTFVFDKTGTLTEDGLKVLGFQTVSLSDSSNVTKFDHFMSLKTAVQ